MKFNIDNMTVKLALELIENARHIDLIRSKFVDEELLKKSEEMVLEFLSKNNPEIYDKVMKLIILK
jgi:transcriptional antiterminator